MPLTLSHAVVALPFVRTPLVPAAIAIGAMTPDLPLFLRGVGLPYSFLHDPANIAWTTVIAGALLLVWWLVLRPASIELAPRWLAERLPAAWQRRDTEDVRATFAPRRRPWHLPMLVLSLLLGVLSHIAWDAFTHEGRWGVEHVPALREFWGPMLGYKWLQYGSSIGGVSILAVCAVIWLRGRPVVALRRRAAGWIRVAWWVSLPAVLAIAWAVGLAVYGPLTPGFAVQHLAYRVLPPACGLWGLLTFILCVLMSLPLRERPRHPA